METSTAALPISFFAAPAAHPRSQALPLNPGAGRRDASPAPTPAYLTPGAHWSLVGTVPGGGDAEARRRLAGRGGGRRRGSPPCHGPSPLPPPAAPRSPVSARRRVRHKQTQLGHTWTAELLRLTTDRGLRTPGLRKPEPPGREGKRTELTLGSGHCHLAPLPPHGSAAAAAAALAFRGPSRQRVQALI